MGTVAFHVNYLLLHPPFEKDAMKCREHVQRSTRPEHASQTPLCFQPCEFLAFLAFVEPGEENGWRGGALLHAPLDQQRPATSVLTKRDVLVRCRRFLVSCLAWAAPEGPRVPSCAVFTKRPHVPFWGGFFWRHCCAWGASVRGHPGHLEPR